MAPAHSPKLDFGSGSNSESGEREVLSGSVDRIVYQDPEDGFTVLRVKIRGQLGLQAVVCHTPSVRPGDAITASGRWVTDRSHGRQFKAGFVRVSQPVTHDGMEKYLSSASIPGIGPVNARRLVAAFGEQVFEVIENEPDRLTEVAGIGKVRARQITKAWGGQTVVREIMTFLQNHGVGAGRATSIYKTYGTDAIQVVSENPYRMTRDIRGIGFQVADDIAKKIGIDPEAAVRVRAGVHFVLGEATSDGHCGLPKEDLVQRAQTLLQVRAELAEEAIRDSLQSEYVVEDTVQGQPCIFLRRLYSAEQGVAQRVVNLLRGEPPWPPVDADKALPWAERKLGFRLAASQVDAVKSALNSKVMVITGGPGVGKTTIVNAILKILVAKGVEIALCAPTGRAAKRLSETTGREAKTIHRLLEFDPVRRKFRRDEGNCLECGLLVVDETSMVDVPLMHSLMKALRPETALLLVGDVDQLPSVGPGRVLADLIESGLVPVARLVEVFRQAARSRIVVNAHRINRGRMPDLSRPKGESDFYFVPADTPEAALDKTIRMVRDRIPARFKLDPIRSVQVLAPMKKGGAGSDSLNRALQAALNPNSPATLERLTWKYGIGDKVMQLRNDYDKEVYNGDIGFIRSVDSEGGGLQAEFDGRVVEYSASDLDALVPAYATTIHKSQGSEYPAVVLLVMNAHFVLLQRNLIYTGVTRGKRLVVLVGQTGAIRRAVETEYRSRRWSKLRELMELRHGGGDA